MASLSKSPHGYYRLQFVHPRTGVRHTVHLSIRDRRVAERVRVMAEEMLDCVRLGLTPTPEVLHWIAGLSDRLRARLAKFGLLPGVSAKPVPTLAKFFEDYMAARSDLKPSTLKSFRRVVKTMTEMFGDNRRLDQISPVDCDRYRSLLYQRMSRNSANRVVAMAKQAFRWAVDVGLLLTNPFGHIRGLVVNPDKSRQQFVPPGDVVRLIEATPSLRFRVVLALARWGGLRVPSEIRTLRWSDIHFADGRMVVRSPKTDRHRNSVRVVPLFPEVRSHLVALWESLPDGAPDQVIASLPDLFGMYRRACELAGVRPWPKPFQNMRASRATELADQYPSHVCAAWLGHSEQIADAFYRQVTDEHFARATHFATHSLSPDRDG